MPTPKLALAKVRRERILWTSEERDKVATEFVLLLLDRPLDPVADLIQEAEPRALPVNRRRGLKGINEPVIREKILSKYTELLSQSRTPVIVETEIETPIDVQFVLNNVPLSELVGAAARRVVAELGAMPSALANFTQHENNNSHNGGTSRRIENGERPCKVKIAVIGLLNGQREVVSSKMPADIELVFLDGSRPHIPSVDFCIVTKFTRHSWWNHVKAELGSKKVWFHEGGLETIAGKIMEVRSQIVAHKSALKILK